MTATAAGTQASPFAIQKQKQPTNVLELLTNDGFKGEVAKVLPKHMNAERMLRVALTTAKMNDKLQQVSWQSFASAMLKCSQYGLEPDGRHAHLIPFKNGQTGGYDLNLIFDYKGLVALVRRSGEVADINADVVYEDDEFVCEKGNNSTLMHRPNFKSKNRNPDNIFAIYSFVRLKDGSPSFEVMTVDEVNAIRNRSQGYQAAKRFNKQSVWDTDWNEMAKKTVFRRHTKWLPLSAEMKEAINDVDDDKLTEDERFNRAKSVAGSVIDSPDFTVPSKDDDESTSSSSPRMPEREAQESGGSVAQPAGSTPPNAVLGEKAPRKKKAEPAPEQQQQQQAPAADPATKTDEPPTITLVGQHDGTRLSMVNAITAAALKCEVGVPAIMAAVTKMGICPEGFEMARMPSEMLQEIIANWTAIVTAARQK